MTEEEFRSQTVEPPFDYATQAEKTNSIVFNPHYVDKADILGLLGEVIANAETMNTFKKLFFRGRTPADMMVDQPSRNDSMGPLLEGATPDEINIIHGIVGVITEAGEMAEILKAFFEGRPFDPVHCLEESGDVEWYQHRILRGIRATALIRDKANIDKLHGRHGEAFDVFRDAHRNLDAERAKLEVAAAPLLEDVAGISTPLDAVPPRSRNDPPLPAGAASAPNVGNGGENIGEAPVERHVKRNVGDCEGMDC